MATTYEAAASATPEVAAMDAGVDAAVDAGTIRARLVPPMPGSVLVGWLAPLAITAIAGFLRFWRLDQPHAIIFDEVYYVHDSMSLLNHGVELDGSSCDRSAGFVVHPPLGKWMMAFGEWLFGTHGTCTVGVKTPWQWTGSFGWRFSAAVVGTLAVLILARTARRMFRSTLLGCVAGTLLAFDALEYVESRAGLLDIFLMFWVVAAFACLVADRDTVRRRYAAAVVDDGRGDWHAVEPGTGRRWWLLAAGVCTGCACAVKWDGVWFLPMFALLAVVWEAGARRTAGLTPYGRRVLDAGWWFVVGSVALMPVIAWFHYWAWSLGTAAVLLALWELAALRPGPVATRVVRGLWVLLATGAIAGAYDLVYYGPTTDVPGVHRKAGPPYEHWVWLGFAVLLVALTALAGWRRPHPEGTWGPPMRHRGWLVPVAMGVVPAATYVTSWTGWFLNPTYAWDHDAWVKPGMGWFAHAHAVFDGWLGYHFQAFWFHEHLYSPHSYASRPLGWILLQRPVAYYYTSPTHGQAGCGVAKCAREVLAVGNPAVFWASIPALVFALWWWLSRRDWRAGALLGCFAIGYFSWFPYSAYLPGTPPKSRTEFIFYILDVLPFMVLALTLAVGVVLGAARARPLRRIWGAATGGAYVVTVVGLFFWFLPILAAVTIPISQWNLRIWFTSWI